MDDAAHISMPDVAEVARMDRRPQLPLGYVLRDEGIYYRVKKKEEDGKRNDVFVCSHIEFFAQTRDDLGDNWSG